MYNYQAPPGYNRPPGYGFPGQQNGPPGMAPPPGMGLSLPGFSPAPGTIQAQPAQPNFPPNFQPRANMPNINFSAPVIRLGTTGPNKPDTPIGGGGRKDGNMESMGNRRGTGLGYERGGDSQRHQMRENMMALAPPTREEIARTIFVGNITEGCGGDDGMQRLLSVAGGLRRWTRCFDANNKPCTFGFAEYEDADSLSTASEIYKDIQVPLKRPSAKEAKKEEDVKMEDAEDEEMPQLVQLLVVVDENSQNYINEWRTKGSLKDPMEAQFRLDGAREELEGVLAAMSRVAVAEQTNGTYRDAEGDMAMQDGDVKMDMANGEIVTIPIAVEDELADIPAEMRETVAKEITAFRDRSNRRDLERLKREEEIEQAERQRNMASRVNRLTTPPPTAAGGANGIPVGPRGVQGAPLGPKGFQGAQIPRDYQKGVAFVNGNGLDAEDQDSDPDDESVEQRRIGKRQAELEKLYLDQEKRWINRERSRTAAIARETQRDRDEDNQIGSVKETVAKRLREWDDEVESSHKVEEYYRDRSLWLRNRAAFRAAEAQGDDADRAVEEREMAREGERKRHELGMADQFLAQQAEELEAARPREQQRFKMSLGAAAQKAQAAVALRRTLAEVEGFLEDEEDTSASAAKRTLIPIAFDSAAEGAGLSEEERAQAARQLAGEIPTDNNGLWNWPVKWEFVDDAVISEQLRPFVEKKIVEYLGVQEQMLVDVVEESVRKRGKPQDLVGELEGALDEEAEVLVKKLWRMLIFFSESEKRGLSA